MENPNVRTGTLTVTYIVALLALAALAIASFFIPQREYRTQQTSDVVLCAASRQEASLERVSFLTYPWLILRLTYRPTNHDDIHVRSYKEEQEHDNYRK